MDNARDNQATQDDAERGPYLVPRVNHSGILLGIVVRPFKVLHLDTNALVHDEKGEHRQTELPLALDHQNE